MEKSTYKPTQYHYVKLNCAGMSPVPDMSNEPKCPFYDDFYEYCSLTENFEDGKTIPPTCPLRTFEITVILKEE